MLRKSILAGLGVGLLLSLGLYYPVISYAGDRFIPGWQNLPSPAHAVLQGISLIFSCLVLVVGPVTATLLWIRPRSTKEAIKPGALAGLTAALVAYILVIAPADGISSARALFELDPIAGLPAESEIAQYVTELTITFFGGKFIPIVAGILWGAAAAAGSLALRNRISKGHAATEEETPPSPGPVLLDRTRQAPSGKRKRARKRWLRWPDLEERTLKAGLLGGLILGGFLALESLPEFYKQFGFEAPPLMERGTPFLSMFTLGMKGILGWLSCLVPFVFLLGGVLVLMLLRNPPSRFRSRILACALGGAVAGLVFYAIFLTNVLGYWATMIRFYMFAEPDAPGSEILPFLPYISVAAYFLAPIFAAPAVISVGASLGLGQGLLYSPVLPQIPALRQPVDCGARLYRRVIRKEPKTALPQIYQLFRSDREAVDVLLHLALDANRVGDGAVAQVAAAYHTICCHPDRIDDALDMLLETLEGQADWRWRAEISELYRVLRAALGAGEVADIAIIVPPPEEQTSSLPEQLSRSLDYLAKIILTLKKYERVDELGGKILYLNNALDAIASAEGFTQTELADPNACRTPYPEQQVLLTILSRWHEMVLGAIRALRGRAELVAELETRRLALSPRLNLEVRVVNVGLNVAEDVHVRLENSTEYRPVEDGAEQHIDILLPGGGRSLEFTLAPTDEKQDSLNSMRVVFDITYNDSVDPEQSLTLADAVDFLEETKPFQRIFPIPYVTGTPLKSPDMFVGREDVFRFVRENLLGAFQNNVIVLHGQRRTGKTSVLYQLERVLGDTHVGVLVDMQGKATRGLVDFLYSLSDDIVYALDRHDIEIDLPPREEYEESPEFYFRSRFLRQVGEALDGRNLLLMFDEFEELQARVESGKLEPTVFSFLRNLMQHEGKLDFVFAGTHKLEELAAEYWSILFNIAAYKRVTFLSEADVAHLITAPVAPSNLEYDPLAVRRIYQVTAGHPYFTQVVCHELVSYHNETQRNYLTTFDVEAALGAIVERGEAHFKYIWAESTPEERWVLLATAEHLAYAESITFAELAAWLRQHHSPLDAAYLPAVLSDLEQRDILMRTAPQSRRYRFKIDLIRRWITANRQLAELLE